jgi:hypothetical protein
MSIRNKVINQCIKSASNEMYYFLYIESPRRKSKKSVYSYKIVDKKDILRSVSDTGIYCSSDNVGTVYLM